MRKKWLNSRLAAGLMAVSLVVVAGCSNGDSASVATVGEEKISKDELNEALVQAYGEKTLEAMIDDKIVEQEIKKEKVEVSKEDIDEEFAVFVENAGGEEAFKTAMEQGGITEKDFKKDIEQYLAIRKLMEPRIKITDEDVEAYFEENKATLGNEEEVDARHILVEDEDLAKELVQKLKDGADFAELAKEHSTDTGSAVEGGELGFFPRGQMMPEFEESAFSLEIGAISEPIKTDYGFHIIQVSDKKEAAEAKLEDHKEDIKEKLFEDGLQTEYVAWLTEKREDYKIDNTLTKE